MRIKTYTIALLASWLILGTLSAKAQFEQKLTLQASGGMVFSLAPESFTDIFEQGFSVDVGVQYNFNRTFSIVAMAKYGTYINETSDDDFDFRLETATFNQLGISLCPKIRFFPRAKVNPYVYAGVNANYIGIKFSMDGDETRSKQEPVCFGVLGGVGLDVRINDNISLFGQGGVARTDFDVVYIDNYFFQIGVNINMFKSRSL